MAWRKPSLSQCSVPRLLPLQAFLKALRKINIREQVISFIEPILLLWVFAVLKGAAFTFGMYFSKSLQEPVLGLPHILCNLCHSYELVISSRNFGGKAPEMSQQLFCLDHCRLWSAGNGWKSTTCTPTFSYPNKLLQSRRYVSCLE